MTHGTHPGNICWMNEILRIWRGYSQNCSPCAILNQKLAVLLILAKNLYQPIYVGQIARVSWINFTAHHMLECYVAIANYIVQYFLTGEMFTYIVGMKKLQKTVCTV